MLQKLSSAKERWGGVHEAIDRWINNRQELLVRFCSIDGLEEFQATPTSVTNKIHAFCEVLVDYVSTGHFDVYEKLLNEAISYNDGSHELYHKLYPAIQKTTVQALDFNDKYASDDLCRSNRQSLQEDLSALGEALETRFQLEDQLIETLHDAHQETLPQS